MKSDGKETVLLLPWLHATKQTEQQAAILCQKPMLRDAQAQYGLGRCGCTQPLSIGTGASCRVIASTAPRPGKSCDLKSDAEPITTASVVENYAEARARAQWITKSPDASDQTWH